jgi:small subunit ribosomal protein S14
MAKTSVIARSKRPPKFKSRVVNRCFRCGRKRAFMRDFGMCRLCFREAANEGLIPGVRKSSW